MQENQTFSIDCDSLVKSSEVHSQGDGKVVGSWTVDGLGVWTIQSSKPGHRIRLNRFAV